MPTVKARSRVRRKCALCRVLLTLIGIMYLIAAYVGVGNSFYRKIAGDVPLPAGTMVHIESANKDGSFLVIDPRADDLPEGCSRKTIDTGSLTSSITHISCPEFLSGLALGVIEMDGSATVSTSARDAHVFHGLFRLPLPLYGLGGDLVMATVATMGTLFLLATVVIANAGKDSFRSIMALMSLAMVLTLHQGVAFMFSPALGSGLPASESARFAVKVEVAPGEFRIFDMPLDPEQLEDSCSPSYGSIDGGYSIICRINGEQVPILHVSRIIVTPLLYETEYTVKGYSYRWWLFPVFRWIWLRA
jgi:hypothetical protein